MQSFALEESISKFEHFLRDHGYFEENDDNLETLNEQVLSKWDMPIKEAITNDFKAHLNISIGKIINLFDLYADQGATVFVSFVTLIDDNSTESLQVIIKAIVGQNKILTYLDSAYANVRSYSGHSSRLSKIFKTLKQADKNQGYFNPISFRSLLQDKRLL
jgi:hypothetical protein